MEPTSFVGGSPPEPFYGRMVEGADDRQSSVVTSSDATLTFVREQLSLAWGFFENVVVPFLSEEVCFWEPSPTCRTVRRSGESPALWIADWEAMDPADASTTLAWDLWHLGMFLAVVHDGTFGEASLRRLDVLWPESVEAAVRWVREGYARWCEGLASLTDGDLSRVGVVDTRGFGDADANPFAERQLGWVLGWVNFEVISMVRAMSRAESVKVKVATP